MPLFASSGPSWSPWLSLVTVLVLGCGPVAIHGEVAIPHPSGAEVRAPATQVSIDADAVAQAYGLPVNSLVDRAALLRVSDREVCVQLALWALPEAEARRDLDRYGFEVIAVRPSERVRVASPAVSNVRSWSEQRNRTVYNRWRGNVTSATPVLYRVGDLCFATETPLVDDQTEALWLTVHAGGRQERFAWRLDEDGRYPDGVGDGSEVRPQPDDAAPAPAGYPAYAAQPAMPAGGGGTGLGSGQIIERVPGGHPVDVQWLEQLFEARFGSLRLCLSHAAEQDARLNRMRGRIVAEFTVGPSGIGNVRIVGNDFTPSAATCMRQHLEEMPVPADSMRWTSLFRYVIGTGEAPGGAR